MTIEFLNKCKSMVADRLSAALPEILVKVDDSLFKLAEKARSNEEYSQYFDAMREVRIKRPGLEAKFRQTLGSAIDEATNKLQNPTQTVSGLIHLSAGLSLLENDEMEESLALSNMAVKIRTSCKQQLFLLDQRVASLLKATNFESEDNPFGPEVICRGLLEACGDLESGIKVKLLMLKLFDKYLETLLYGVYKEINARLSRRGVLPNLRLGTTVTTRPSTQSAGARDWSPRHAEKIAKLAAQHVSDGYQAMSDHPAETRRDNSIIARQSDSNLSRQVAHDGQGMASDRQLNETASYVPIGKYPEILDMLHRLTSIDAASIAAVDSESIVSLGPAIRYMTHLQRQDSGVVNQATPFADRSPIPAGAKNILGALRDSEAMSAISDVDDIIIDVVAMMFDFILTDKAIPDAMRGLIGKLQIPMVKVAVIDKTFFAKRSHPARRLLDKLAETAAGWEQTRGQSHVVFTKIQELVHRILSEFEDDIRLFEVLLSDFDDFLKKQDHIAEKQVRAEAKAAEEQERFINAKRKAAEEIRRRVDADIPEPVQDFLVQTWREVLATRYFKYGEGSSESLDDIRTMDELLWSVNPDKRPVEKARLREMLPALVEQLKQGMVLAATPEDERDLFLAELANLHLRIFRANPDAEHTGQTPVANAQPQEETPIDPKVDDTTEIKSGTQPAKEGENWNLQFMNEAIEKSNALIHRAASAKREFKGMGATFAATRFYQNKVTVAHVGDSRIYRFRDGAFEQITIDHTLRQQLIDQGFYTPEEADKEVARNLVTRALGVGPSVNVDVKTLQMAQDDVYLICSDGLSDMVDDSTLSNLLENNASDLQLVVEAMLQTANDNGGKDNVSVILAKAVRPRTKQQDPPEDTEPFKVEFAGASDVGRVRSHNEDSFLCNPETGLAVLADGMGGYNGGDVASAIAVKVVMNEYGDAFPLGPESQATGYVAADVDTLLVSAQTQDVTNTENGETSDLGDNMLREIFDLDLSDADSKEFSLGEENSSTRNDEYSEIARTLKVGDWIEFRRRKGKLVRGRLRWISPDTGKFLFTDQLGAKVAESTPTGLALELRTGSALVVKDVPLFDRAMNTVKQVIEQRPRTE